MATVNLDLQSNIDNLTKEISKFGDQATKSLSSVESSFNALKVIGGAVAGVFAGRALINGISAITDAAAVQEQAVQQLNTALALSGELSEENSQRFQDFASELQANSTIGDELTLSMIGLTKSFGASNEQAELILQTAADLSAVTGQTLESSVRNLSKTLGGLKGELGETQPELAGLTKEQLQAGDAITILNQKFAGASKALTKTFSGAVTQASNSFGDFQEQLGAAIVDNPAVVAALNTITESLNDLGPIVQGTGKSFVTDLVGAMAAFIDISALAIRGIGQLRLALDFGAAIDLAILAFANLNLAVTETIADLQQAFLDFDRAAFQTVIDGALKFAGVMESLGIVSEDTLSEIQGFARETNREFDASSSALTASVEQARLVQQAAEEQFTNTALAAVETKESFDATADVLEKFSSRLKTNIQEVDNSDEALKRLSEANKGSAQAARDAQKSSAEQAKALGELRKGVDSVKAGLDKARDAADPLGAIDRRFKAEVATIEQARDQRILSEAEAADAITKLTENAAVERNKIIEDENEKRRKAELEAEKKKLEELKAATQAGLADPFRAGALGEAAAGTEFGKALQDPTVAQNVAATISVTNSALKGAEGARTLITQAAGTIADKLLPGVGSVVTSILDVLTLGPDQTRELIRGFIDAVPLIVESIALSIPVVIEELAGASDKIIIALAKATPRIAVALAKAMPGVALALARTYLRLDLAKAINDELKRELDIDAIAELEKAGDKLKEDASAAGEVFIERAGQALSQFAESARGIVDALTQAFNPLAEIGQQFIAGLNSAFTAYLDVGRQIRDGLLEVFFKLPEAGTAAANAFKEAGPAVADALKQAGTVFADGIKQAFQTYLDIGQQIIDGLGSVFNVFLDINSRVVEGLRAAFTAYLDVGQQVVDGLTSAFSSIGNLGGIIGDQILGVFSQVGDLLRQSFDQIVAGLTMAFDSYAQIGEDVWKGLSRVVDRFARIGEDVADFIKDAFDFDLPEIGGGGGGGGFLGRIGLQEGGEVPQGFPNDSFPAALTSGENVISAGLSDRLERFLNQQGGGAGAGQVNVVLQVGEKQLADVLIDLDRQGIRTAI